MDGRALPAAAFDLVCLFDALHHLTEPGAVLGGIREALRPGGSLLLAEAALSGDAAADATDPTAVIVYGSDLIYCFQESKTPGESGLGATWPGRGLEALLATHGFTEAGRVASQAGYVVLRAVPTLRTPSRMSSMPTVKRSSTGRSASVDSALARVGLAAATGAGVAVGRPTSWTMKPRT